MKKLIVLVLLLALCSCGGEPVTCTINTDVALLMPNYTDPGWALSGDPLDKGEVCEYLDTIQLGNFTLYKVNCQQVGYVLASECDK